MTVRARRLTARARITLVCTALIVTVTIVILVAVWLFMRFVPTYAITSRAMTGNDADMPTSCSTPLEPAAAPSAAIRRGSTGVVIRSESDVLSTLSITSAGLVVPVIALGALTSWIVAGRLLRPVHELTRAARRAADGSLDHRIRSCGPQDEFGQLADTFDEMLDRLQASFDAHRRFAANASHELRTPLATTKAVLDSALRHPDRVDPRDALRRLRETNDDAREIVQALLELTEASGGHLKRTPVSLTDVVEQATLMVEHEARHESIAVDSTLSEVVVEGDRALLERLVVNLLQNAIRHNVPGGRMAVRLESCPTVLQVENSGDHSADDVLALIAEPLYRARGRIRDDDRRRGHGLGLALVASIATAHDADLRIMPSQDGGLVVRVRFGVASRAYDVTSAEDEDGTERASDW